ncbi:MAG: hotdog fold thioesterase [Methanoregula sp.]
MPTPRKNTNNPVFPDGDTAGREVSPPGDEPQEADRSGKTAAFNACDFARLMGMHITGAGDGYARVEMDCTGKCSPRGVAHGGAIFSLADHAFGIAANYGETERVAVSVHIQYIAPAHGKLVAIAQRVSDNGTCDTYRVMVYEGSRTVAAFEGVAFRISP